jgi:hypothetical protein
MVSRVLQAAVTLTRTRPGRYTCRLNRDYEWELLPLGRDQGRGMKPSFCLAFLVDLARTINSYLVSPGRTCAGGCRTRLLRRWREDAVTRPVTAGPIDRAIVVVVEMGFILAINCRGLVPCRAIFDRLARQIHVYAPLLPTYAGRPFGRDQHLLAEQPATRLDDEIPYLPSLVVDNEIWDVTDDPVRSMNVVSAHLLGAS